MKSLREIITRKRLGIAIVFSCLGAGFFTNMYPYTLTQQVGVCDEKNMQSCEYDLIFNEAFVATGDKNISMQVTDAIREAATNENLDPLFLTSVIKQESNFYPNSANDSGGIGLMMISKEAAEDTNLNRNKLTENVKIGARILHHFLEEKSSEDKNTAFKIALIGFHCGENGVKIYNQNPDNLDRQVIDFTERVMENYKQLIARQCFSY